MHNLCLALGWIVKKPWAVENEIMLLSVLTAIAFDVEKRAGKEEPRS